MPVMVWVVFRGDGLWHMSGSWRIAVRVLTHVTVRQGKCEGPFLAVLRSRPWQSLGGELYCGLETGNRKGGDVEGGVGLSWVTLSSPRYLFRDGFLF